MSASQIQTPPPQVAQNTTQPAKDRDVAAPTRTIGPGLSAVDLNKTINEDIDRLKEDDASLRKHIASPAQIDPRSVESTDQRLLSNIISADLKKYAQDKVRLDHDAAAFARAVVKSPNDIYAVANIYAAQKPEVKKAIEENPDFKKMIDDLAAQAFKISFGSTEQQSESIRLKTHNYDTPYNRAYKALATIVGDARKLSDPRLATLLLAQAMQHFRELSAFSDSSFQKPNILKSLEFFDQLEQTIGNEPFGQILIAELKTYVDTPTR